MSKEHTYFVYILSSETRTLYIGVTNDMERRLYEHNNNLLPGFTATYNVHSLVYYESYNDIGTAISREKQIKKWRREKKVGLIESMNPDWEDLSETWGK